MAECLLCGVKLRDCKCQADRDRSWENGYRAGVEAAARICDEQAQDPTGQHCTDWGDLIRALSGQGKDGQL